MKPENREDVELETHIQDVFPKGLGNDTWFTPQKKNFGLTYLRFQNVLLHRDLPVSESGDLRYEMKVWSFWLTYLPRLR